MLAVSAGNVVMATTERDSSMDIVVENIEMMAEGDGGLCSKYGLDWLGPLGQVLDLGYHSSFTGKEWIPKGKVEDKGSDFYGREKYLCESKFFGVDDCTIAAVLYGDGINRVTDIPIRL